MPRSRGKHLKESPSATRVGTVAPLTAMDCTLLSKLPVQSDKFFGTCYMEYNPGLVRADSHRCPRFVRERLGRGATVAFELLIPTATEMSDVLSSR